MFCKQLKPDHVTPSPLSSPKEKGRKPCLTYPLWLSNHPVCCHLHGWPSATITVAWQGLICTNANAVENRLPKNTGVIAYWLKVLWKFLMRPNYYNITVIYSNTCFWANLLQVLQVLVMQVTQHHKWRRLDAAYLTCKAQLGFSALQAGKFWHFHQLPTFFLSYIWIIFNILQA
jgi:hypothetical protein